MGLQDSVYNEGIKDLLMECFDKDALCALASKATNNKIKAHNRREAVELILRYTDSLVKFFSYRGMKSKLLFSYLHKRNVTTVKSTDAKEELKDKIEKYWEEKSAAQCDRGAALVARPRETQDERSSLQPLKSSHPQHTHAHAHYSGSSSVASGAIGGGGAFASGAVGGGGAFASGAVGGGGGGDLNLFKNEFCKWFYNMINGLQTNRRGVGDAVFSPDIFMANAYMSICLQGFQSEEEYTTLGPQQTYDVFRNVCNKYKLIFVTNSEFGIRGEVSEYGLVRIFCNGTLQINNAMRGVFEQEFEVVKNVEGRLKITMMKVNLKS